MNGATNLAQAHSKAISEFITEEEMVRLSVRYYQLALFGDPDLMFGGIPHN